MILVTGANGLVGSYLCRYLLRQGHSIRALTRENSDMRLVADIRDDIEWVKGDILDIISLEDAISGVKKIFHCAGFISYKNSNAFKLMQLNAVGTENLINVALQGGIEKFLHVSSIAALGRQGISGESVGEEAPWEMKKLSTGYARSKFAAEREVWRGIAEGLPAVIINPSIILGAGNWNNGSCKLFNTVYNGLKYYTTGGTGYVDVRDVARIAYLLMEGEITGERFILNAENIIYRDLLFQMADALHVARPPKHAGTFLSGIAWRTERVKEIFTGSEPVITKETARIANSTTCFLNNKISQALHYDFIPIAQTIQETANAFLEEKKDQIFHPLNFNACRPSAI